MLKKDPHASPFGPYVGNASKAVPWTKVSP